MLSIGLNHVVRECSVDVAHAIDVEVIRQCESQLESNAAFVVMPWKPHVRGTRGLLGSEVFFGPGERSLEDYCQEIPVLQRLSDQGRLLWYNLATAGEPYGTQPVIRAKSFSASAVVGLLAESGVKTIRTLGVDGGSSYSAQFGDLSGSTLLPTYHQSFDIQFREIANTIHTRSLDLAPLDMEQPIVVFVGTEPAQTLAARVLEHSIRKHASMNVRVSALFEEVERHGLEIPPPRDEANAPRTPFSFQRFAIPALKGYKGRAIYLDSDMLVFDDLRQLWAWPFDGAQILSVDELADSGRRPQFSVMVLDCEELQHWDPKALVDGLDTGRWTYEQLVYEMAAAERISAAIPSRWNDLERYEEGATALTHFTDMNMQPWLSTENLAAHIWCRELIDAVDAGFIDAGMVEDHVRRGWIRPSLLYQLEHEIVDPLLLPADVRKRDRLHFVPPHRSDPRLRSAIGVGEYPNRWQVLARRGHALARHAFEKAGGRELIRRGRRRLARLRRS